ncbi:MAG: 30S ribosomal protein S3 [Candidatus Omnitrophica bacterium]|nr:30S ribosomal protein S3 [Candidatus Omnitrophota bacterium]
MGQKVHPYIQRIGLDRIDGKKRTWLSLWFARPKNFARFVVEDRNVRQYIKKKFKQAAISKICIERLAERVRVRIASARPGIIIGRHGSDIERLRDELNNILKSEVSVDIEEVKNPALDAQLVAENISLQIEKRIAFRRAIKRSIEQSMSAGAKGVKICCAGRLGGAEMCRTETYKQGKVPLQTLRADIDYGFAESYTTYGLIGTKVWIFKGDTLIEKSQAPQPEDAAAHPGQSEKT